MPQPAKLVSLFIMLAFFGNAYSQTLSGTVTDKESGEPVPGAHVINKRTLKGDLTDASGRFSLSLKWGDTIVFSNIAHQYFYFIYNDSATALQNVEVELLEQNYLLDEVGVYSYKLTTNEPKEMELGKPSIPSSDELGDGRIVNAGAQNPAEFLYNLFGSKPRQLRELAKLKSEDAYREKLEESNNRQSVVKLTGLTREEMEAFMFYCKYAPVKMRTMNDYEFLLSVQHCFRQYVREREMEEFLQQFD